MADDSPKRIEITGGNVTPAASSSGAPPPSQQSFSQKLIEVTITLSPNTKTGQPVKFAGSDSNTVTLSGFRMNVRIENSGGVNGRASVTIFGLNPSVVNQLSTLGIIFDMVQKNSVLISAGDSNGLSPVFAGTILNAFGHYNDLPTASLHMECQIGQYEAIKPIAASSFPQPTDVSTIMAGFAAQIPAGFENNGVSVQMPPCYYPGTLRDQIRALASDAHINAELLPGAGGAQVLAIWPMGGSRTSQAGQDIPLISKETGMILTPSFAPNGFAIVRTLFNPQISFGGVVQIKTDVTPQANRAWVVYNMSLALDCFVRKGRWEQTLSCYPKGFPAPVPPSAGSS